MVVLAQDGPLRDVLAEAGIEVCVRPLAVLRRELLSPRGMARVATAWAGDAGGLGRLARARGAALVHTNTSVTLGGSAAARIARVPHVWHVRELYEQHSRAWPAYRRLLETADVLACVSAATAAQFDGPIRPGGAQVRVVADGLSFVPRRAPRAAARAALGLDDDAFCVALLGRLSAWKGQEVLVRALPLAGSRTAALIAGDAWGGDPRPARELDRLARGLGVRDRVHLLGFREDVEQVLGAADVVCVPSTAPDPLPNSALEAAAAGVCVVAADHGGLPEIVRDGETGVLVAPGDPEALGTALRALAADSARVRALGEAAAQDVRVRFAPERLLDGVQALWDELATRP